MNSSIQTFENFANPNSQQTQKRQKLLGEYDLYKLASEGLPLRLVCLVCRDDCNSPTVAVSTFRLGFLIEGAITLRSLLKGGSLYQALLYRR